MKKIAAGIFLSASSMLLAIPPVAAGLDTAVLGAGVGAVPDIGATVEAGSEKDMISVNFNRADIQSVLRILALKGNVNIVAGPEVAAEVTIQLKDVPWKSAFETIVSTYGYAYEQDGNIYRVMTVEAFQQMGTEGVRSEVITLQYADLTQVVDALRNVISGITIEPIAGTNQLVLTSNISNLNMAHDLLSSIDQKLPQVHIDTKIVRTALNKSENLGIDWNVVFGASGARRPHTFPFSANPDERKFGQQLVKFNVAPTGQTAAESTTTTTAGGASVETSTDFPIPLGFPFVGSEEFSFGTLDFSNFTAVFSAIKSRANTKVISNPRLVVLNHQQGRVQSGNEIGIPTFERNESTGSFEITGYEARNDGIEVVVTPHIAANGDILLNVRPELTQFLGFTEVVAGSNVLSPNFQSTVAETEVMIHNGDTLVIGGLINEAETDTRSKIPILGDIPFFGKPFRNQKPGKDRAETIIFMTVVMADDVYNTESIAAWKKSQEEYEAFRKYSESGFFRSREEEKSKPGEEATAEEVA